MATIQKGIHGMISGKIGSMVYYNNNGKQVVRSMPRKVNNIPTAAQVAQQMRFGLIIDFFSALKSLIRKGYGSTNNCISYHVKNAVTGSFPNLELDYSKIVLTRGILINASNASAINDGKAALNFSWINWGNANDEAILVVYNPAKQRHVWLRTSVKRASKVARLTVPEHFSGDTLHCWIAFIAENGKQFSDSVYLGTVTMNTSTN